MSDNEIVVTKEQIQKAMACETAEELMELAKEVGIELTKEAGGGCYLESTTPGPKVQDILKSTTAILMFN